MGAYFSECSVAPSCSKDTQYLHGYPKNAQLSPPLRNNHHFNNNNSNNNNEPSGHHDRRHGRQNYQNNNGEPRRHHRNTPPINICETAGQNSLTQEGFFLVNENGCFFMLYLFKMYV